MYIQVSGNHSTPNLRSGSPNPPAEGSPLAWGVPPQPDLQCIDRADEAALVPALQPGVLLTTANALASAASYGLELNSHLEMQLGDHATASLDFERPVGAPPGTPMTVTGTLAGLPVRETWTYTLYGLQIQGSLGNNQENLAFVSSPWGGYTLYGQVGQVPVQERVQSSLDGQTTWLAGTLGATPVQHQINVGTTPQGYPALQIGGQVGKASTRLEEHLTAYSSTSETLLDMVSEI